jgi:hypothetical protein
MDKGTDKVIAEFFSKAGDAILKLLGVFVEGEEVGDIGYNVRVIKQKEIKPDLEVSELYIRGEPLRVYVEIQGYADKYVIYRALSGALLASKVDDYDGKIMIGVIYMSSRYKGIAIKPVRFEGIVSLREIAIDEYRSDELLSIDERLCIFIPYAKDIRSEVDLERSVRGILGYVVGRLDKELIDHFIMMVISRFKRLSVWEVREMFRLDIRDSLAFRQVYEMGLEDGRREGVQQGIEEGMREGEYRSLVRIARMLYELGDDIDKIARVTNLSEEEIRRIIREKDTN